MYTNIHTHLYKIVTFSCDSVSYIMYLQITTLAVILKNVDVMAGIVALFLWSVLKNLHRCDFPLLLLVR